MNMGNDGLSAGGGSGPAQILHRLPKRKHIFSLRVAIVLGILCSVIVLCVAGWLVVHRNQTINDFHSAQLTVNFPLFVPSSLPAGYVYANHSLSVHNGVAVFRIGGPNGHSFAVTEQMRPSGFDFSQLSGTKEFTTSLGQAYIEDFDLRTTGSIVGTRTWLIINTDSPVGADVMESILSAFSVTKSP